MAHEYGLLIERKNEYGTEYVSASVVRREPDKDYPLGCSNDGWDGERPKHMVGTAMDGLGIKGFCSDSDGEYLCHGVEYRDVHAANESQLKRMVKTIARANRRLDKDSAHREPGDKLVSLAAAFKMTFVVERLNELRNHYSDNKWRWMTVAEGRNRYRDLIAEAKAATLEKIGHRKAVGA